MMTTILIIACLLLMAFAAFLSTRKPSRRINSNHAIQPHRGNVIVKRSPGRTYSRDDILREGVDVRRADAPAQIAASKLAKRYGLLPSQRMGSYLAERKNGNALDYDFDERTLNRPWLPDGDVIDGEVRDVPQIAPPSYPKLGGRKPKGLLRG